MNPPIGPHSPDSRQRAKVRLRRMTRSAVIAAAASTALIGVVVAKEHPGASSAASSSTTTTTSSSDGSTSSAVTTTNQPLRRMTVLHRHPMQPRPLRHLLLGQPRRRPQPLRRSQPQLPQGAPDVSGVIAKQSPGPPYRTIVPRHWRNGIRCSAR